MNIPDFLEQVNQAQEKKIERMTEHLQLILEVHPTKNSHDAYVATVQALAAQALKDERK